MQQIYYKQNETFETEFFKDKECTQLITDWSEYKNIYIELKNGNITPLCVLKDITTPIDIFCGYIHRNVKGFNRIQTLDDITPNL